MQVGAPGAAVPNPLQYQQAIAPIAETGGNDLETPASQRVEQPEATEASQKDYASTSGRGQVIDIYA
jgi:hypothetical protein